MKPAPEGWVNSPTRIEPAGTELSPAPAADAGDDLEELIGQQVGNYVIESLLGQGGMAVVYLARHPALGREVAVKMLNPEYKTDFDLNRRFLQEAQVTANFRHPNIVEIYDLGEIDGRAYYTMERLLGTDLATLVAKKGRFRPSEVAEYLSQIGKALEVAHRQGIVHRDLKPANIFVTDETPLLLKLMDFGIAKVSERRRVNATQRGEVLGTPAYMAPEQALGHVDAISVATDIYALGIIAYELLSGRLPFVADSDMLLLAMQIRDEPPPLAEVAPDVPKAVADVVERCLAKDPHERPRSVVELMEALTRAVESSSSKAARPGAPGAPGGAPRTGATAALRHGTAAARSPATAARVQPAATATRAQPAATAARAQPAATAARAQPVAAAPAQAPARSVARRVTGAQAAPPPELAPVPPKPVEPAVAKAAADAREELDEDELDLELDREEAAPEPSAHELEADADELPLDEAELGAAGGGSFEPVPIERPRLLSELIDEPAGGGPIALSAEDGRVLDKLLRRMQRRADFPSFLNNVTEISRKADADADFSAWQLSEAILKDFALTAKLLRMVNSLFASRFGGKVFSVKQAVIILGFDSVRSMALGISVYKLSGQRSAGNNPAGRPNKFHDELADTAINSLIAGEIARNLAFKAGIKDTELAMMCAMFRNLGQQLVIEYMPEEYQRILALADSARISRSAAAQRILGTTLPKIGLGVAERWHLPKLMRQAMASNPAQDAALLRDEDRLAALSKLSNDLCHIIATGDRPSYKPLMQRLLATYKRLLTLHDQDVSALLGTVCKSFETRYSALFGPYHRKARFLFNARSLTGEPAPVERRTAPPLDPNEITGIEQTALALQQGLAKKTPPDLLLAQAMGALSSGLAAPRVILLTMTTDRKELEVRFAHGEDAGTLKSQLRVPITQGGDIFSSALRSSKNVVVEDALGPGVMRRLPQRYFETLGSASFALYVCASRGYPTCLLLVDADAAQNLPPRDRVKATKVLRELVAKIAERR
jgi:HD-like signal output (HDOD) protein/tRNA A-37 threonylcarbamoyl transferase component Bud32